MQGYLEALSTISNDYGAALSVSNGGIFRRGKERIYMHCVLKKIGEIAISKMNYISPAVARSPLSLGVDFCSYSMTTTKIRFLQDFGDLPLIVADGAGLGLSVGSSPRISVTKIQGGTKENEPCKIAARPPFGPPH